MKNLLSMFTTLAAVALLVACGAVHDEEGQVATGSIGARLTLPSGNDHDVSFVNFVIVEAGSACNAVPVAEITTAVEEEALVTRLTPEGSGGGLLFADGLMVLPPGNYHVCAQPLNEDLRPSDDCALVESDIVIAPEATTEIVLVSQCTGIQNGAADVVVAFNDPPMITDLTIGPSKFITTCETAELNVEASDPNGDLLDYGWEIVTAPGSAVLIANGSEATFRTDIAGDYEVTVTVTDATGGSVSLTFPIHVSEDEDCDVACPAGTVSVSGLCWLISQPGETGTTSCERVGLVGSAATVEGLTWTPALMAEVSAALGCDDAGADGSLAVAMSFDPATNECTTGSFSADLGRDYENLFNVPVFPTNPVHACQP